MFGLSLGETAIILLVALVVVGPKELPQVIKVCAGFISYIKGLISDFKAQVEEVAKDAGLHDIRKELEENEVFTQMPTIIDLEGNPQPVFDISEDLAEREKKRATVLEAQTPAPATSEELREETSREGEKAQ